MARLRIGAKIGLVVGAALLPLLALLLLQVREVAGQRQQALAGRAAMAVLQAAYPLQNAVLALRALAEPLPDGASATVARADDTRAEALRALSAFEKAVQDAHGVELQASTTPLRQYVQAVADGRSPYRPAEAGAMHVRALRALSEVTVLAVERGGLEHQPDRATQSLAHVVVQALLPLVDAIGTARASGTALLSQDAAAAAVDARAAALAQSAQVEILAAQLTGDMAGIERAHGIGTGSWDGTRVALGEFTEAARRSFVAAQWPVDARAFFDRGSAALLHVTALTRDLSLRIDQRLADAVARHERALIALMVAGFAAASLVLYLASCAFFGLRGTVKAMRRALESVARGDLADRVAVRGRDELADIGRTVDTMNERLSSMVAEIRTHAERVDAAGAQTSQGSERLAARTEEQARSVATSTAAMSQLSTAVAHNAQAARALDELTQRLFVQAEGGQSAMAETIAAMQDVQTSTEQVTSIVNVIDEVAFQTGMLAINASVEAARAGEAGKGFAVVAAEVRQLAARCAESAEEIRELLGTSARQVDASSLKLQNASIALDGIVGGVREVSGELRTIATASTLQSAGLDEVSAGIAALDGITRDNAALVEESHAAARTLVERADALKASVASMRLRQGSPDEAIALVDRAIEHTQRCGRAQALEDFHQAEGPWTDRDLYLIAFDRLGNVMAYGADRSLVGTSVNDTPGVAGTAFLDQAWDAAHAGGGWVRYQVLNPATGAMSAKESWFRQLDDDTVIGCGVFLAGQAMADVMAARAVSWSTTPARPVRLAGA